ncbi:MAG: hypothetical protein HKN53_01775 [Maribacter sp.]|nr:hypothetical protein [Maribacter sp.]
MENKTGKYLKYAIGEITLVMIGILLALQINNWNNNRIERQTETSILNEILANLKMDVNNLNSKIELNADFSKKNKIILDHLERKTPLTDSLKYYYARLLGRGTFQPITVGYENLKSKGNDIIQNDSLRIAISALYDFKYFYVTEDLRSDYTPIRDVHMSEVIKNIKKASKPEGNFKEPVDLVELQNNTYFKEVMSQALDYYWWMNRQYKKGIAEIKAVQQQIRTELNHRES